MRTRFLLHLFLSIGCVGSVAQAAIAEAPHLEVSTTTIEVIPLPDRSIHTDAELGVIWLQLAEMMRLAPQTTIKVVAPAPKPPTAPTAPGMEVEAEEVEAEEPEEVEEVEAEEAE